MNIGKDGTGKKTKRIVAGDRFFGETARMARSKRKIPFIEKCFRAYLESEDSAQFVCVVSSRYTEYTLTRLATSERRGTRRAATMALGFVGTFRSNAILAKALRDRDRAVRMLAENGIRSLWNRAAGEWYDHKIEAISWLNFSFQYEHAMEMASEVIEQVPSFAEAWNQRALSCYGLGQFELAIGDCQQTLDLNPFHFLAASGMGNSYLQQKQSERALECFQRALKLNPGLDGVRAQVDRLHRTLG